MAECETWSRRFVCWFDEQLQANVGTTTTTTTALAHSWEQITSPVQKCGPTDRRRVIWQDRLQCYWRCCRDDCSEQLHHTADWLNAVVVCSVSSPLKRNVSRNQSQIRHSLNRLLGQDWCNNYCRHQENGRLYRVGQTKLPWVAYTAQSAKFLADHRAICGLCWEWPISFVRMRCPPVC